MSLTIKTDHKWRDLVYRADVPAKVLADQFDYQDAEKVLDGFFCYRRNWYHLDQFMAVEGNGDLKGWDGYAGDSYFSGVLIQLSRDGEQVKTGTYFS
jgi:hypothetical protein